MWSGEKGKFFCDPGFKKLLSSHEVDTLLEFRGSRVGTGRGFSAWIFIAAFEQLCMPDSNICLCVGPLILV